MMAGVPVVSEGRRGASPVPVIPLPVVGDPLGLEAFPDSSPPERREPPEARLRLFFRSSSEEEEDSLLELSSLLPLPLDDDELPDLDTNSSVTMEMLNKAPLLFRSRLSSTQATSHGRAFKGVRSGEKPFMTSRGIPEHMGVPK